MPPSEVRVLPTADVFLMLRFLHERNAAGRNAGEIDLAEVDPENLAKVLGAE